MQDLTAARRLLLRWLLRLLLLDRLGLRLCGLCRLLLLFWLFGGIWHDLIRSRLHHVSTSFDTFASIVLDRAKQSTVSENTFAALITSEKAAQESTTFAVFASLTTATSFALLLLILAKEGALAT